jgi:hypothetical protein
MLQKLMTIAVPAGTGNQSYSCGFEPKAIIFNTVRATALDTEVPANPQDGGAGIGFTDGVNQWSLGIGMEYPTDDPFQNGSLTYDDHCIHAMDNDDGLRCSAEIVSFDPGGFTLNWDVIGPTGALVVCTVLGGDIQAHVTSFDLQSAGGDHVIDGAGFQPTFAVALHAYDGDPGTAVQHSEWGVGFAAGVAQQFAHVYGAQYGGSTTNKHEGLYEDRLSIGTDPTVGTLDWAASLDSFDADGITIAVDTAPTVDIPHGLLLIGGCEARAGAGTFTGTGDETVTPTGILPRVIGLYSLINDARSHGSIISNAGDWANGWATVNDEYGLYYDVGGGSFNNGIWRMNSRALQSWFSFEEFALSLTAMSEDSFTLDIVANAGGATRPYAWFALGEACGEGEPYAFRGVWNGGAAGTQDATSSYQTFLYDSIEIDTHSFDGGSGQIVIPATGIYLLHGSFRGAGSNRIRGIKFVKNGTDDVRGNSMPANTAGDPFTATAHWVGCLEAGDVIELQGTCNVTIASTGGFMHVARIPLPFVTAYQNGDVSGAGYIGYTVESDLNGWQDPGDDTKFIVPESGDYFVSVSARSVGGQVLPQLYVNGASTIYYAQNPVFDVDPYIHALVPLVAGDELQVRVDSSAATLDRVGAPNHFAMFKLNECEAHVATRDTSNTTTSAGGTRMAFAIEDSDTDGFHSNVTNNTRLTVPTGKDGIYLVFASFWMNYGVVVNGAIGRNNFPAIEDYADYSLCRGGTNSPPTLGLLELNAGDYVELNVYTGSTGQTAFDLRFAMIRLDDLAYLEQICPGDVVDFVPQIIRYDLV